MYHCVTNKNEEGKHINGDDRDDEVKVRLLSDRDAFSFGDANVMRALQFPVCSKKLRDDEMEDGVQYVKYLLSRGANATLVDKDGNLPFFLSAASSQTTASFLMARAAGSQGIFDRVSRKPTADGKRKQHEWDFQAT